MFDLKTVAAAEFGGVPVPVLGRAVLFVGADGLMRARMPGGEIVQVLRGDVGPVGVSGVAGAVGVAGPKGDTGAAGAPGVAGPKGDTGAAGATGVAGPKGDTGVTGAPGVAGLKGDAGAAGSAGGGFPATFMSVSGASGQSIGAAFATLQTATLEPASNLSCWSASDWSYVVPADGIYLLQGAIRANDSTPSGIQFGVGIHTSGIDGVWFVWHCVQATTVVQRRTSYPVVRTAKLIAGQKVRMFAYVDSATIVVQSAAWQVIRLA